MVYTDGVRYLADKAKCYWLIDTIAIKQSDNKVKNCEFQVWQFYVENEKGVLTMREDGNADAIISEKIQYTDFPLPYIEIWVSDGVIFLPSEY